MTDTTAPLQTTPVAMTAPKQEESLSETIKSLVWAITIAVAMRSFLFTPFNIPSASMVGNLLVGDYLFVSKYAYGFSRYSLPFGLPIFDGRIFQHQPKRGDVIVFKWPADDHMDYIKRLVGLPGDHIQMKDGVLYINDLMVKKERTTDFVLPVSENSNCNKYSQYQVQVKVGKVECHLPQYRETMPAELGGATYTVIDQNSQGELDNTRVFVVPDKHYFAEGDNRDDSSDSRVAQAEGGVGYIPEENLVGRAEVRFFSTDGSSSWWNPISWFQAARWQRLFTRIR